MDFIQKKNNNIDDNIIIWENEHSINKYFEVRIATYL